MSSCILEPVEVAGPTRWRWLLTDEAGEPLASHQVDLDSHAEEYKAFEDLYRFLHWQADPDDRVRSEAALVGRVGAWIGEHALGATVVEELLAEAPVTVRVRVPPALGFLPYRPWELASASGVVLAREQVGLVYELPGRGRSLRVRTAANGGPRPVRILALFSMPDGPSVLGLRRERRALTQLVRRVSGSRVVELRVLQYGVTRDELSRAVDDGDGWDLLHLSGHGGRGELLLETPDAQPDPIRTDELVDLLLPLRKRLRLAVLSTCESGAATAAETLRLLDLTGPAQVLEEQATAQSEQHRFDPTSDGPGDAASGLGVARGLAERLGCAVLAMRFPVVDDFAIGLAGRVYEQVLVHGQPVDVAVARAVPRAAGLVPSLGAPPVSLGTPVLLGPAVGLRLPAPVGAVPVGLGMAGFPPEPARFVGRTATLAAARQVLAPFSEWAGVLLHGMAGSGKTTAAVELAYQAGAAFDAVGFWTAPPPEQWRSALPQLAQSLEVQLNRALNPDLAPDRPLLRLAEHLTGEQALQGYLPVLTELLEQTSCLIVLDNLESLLSESGGWLDPRLGQVLAALTAHRGGSRLVLTSRTVPVELDSMAVRVLPLHTLTREESALLARELPNLRNLLHDTEPASRGRADPRVRAERDLVRRTLAVVQGHPKLLELADATAADPALLAQRLEAAEQAAVERGTPLAAFLDTGSSQLDPEELLMALADWTTSISNRMAPASLLLLQVLACAEPNDRTTIVLNGTRTDLWASLGQPSDVPEVHDAVAPLVAAALIDPQPLDPNNSTGSQTYVLHPGVADTVRSTTPRRVQETVDTVFADFWTMIFQLSLQKEEDGGEGWLVVQAALGATPYLLRQKRYGDAGRLLQAVLLRDRSPGTIAVVLPLLERITNATRGTERELIDQAVLAAAIRLMDPRSAEIRLREVMQDAVERQRYQVASASAQALINLLRDTGRLSDALSLVERMTEYTKLGGGGPWSELSDIGQRLQILFYMGRTQDVLDEVHRLRDLMGDLPKQPGDDDNPPWHVQERILEIGSLAAQDLKHYKEALDLNADVDRSQQQRGAGEHERAQTRFNFYPPLLRLGRLEEAESLLQACQSVFEQTGDTSRLGLTLSARADIAAERGHRQSAINLENAGLSKAYLQPRPGAIAKSHNNLANLLSHGQMPPRLWLAHLLAGALLRSVTGALGELQGSLRTLGWHLRDPDVAAALPVTVHQVCGQVEQSPGVRFGLLLDALLPDRAAQQAALDTLLDRAQSLTDAQLYDIGRHLQYWEPMLGSVVAAINGNAGMREQVQEALDSLADHPDWARLAVVLRRVLTGERDPEQLLQGLDPVSTAISTRLLGALASGLTLESTLTATESFELKPQEPVDQRQQIAAGVVAAAYGDATVARQLAPLLDQLDASADGAALADALRAILAGERDPGRLLAGLGEYDITVVQAVLTALKEAEKPMS